MPLYIKIYAGEYSSNTNFSCHRIKVINSLEEKKKKVCEKHCKTPVLQTSYIYLTCRKFYFYFSQDYFIFMKQFKNFKQQSTSLKLSFP